MNYVLASTHLVPAGVCQLGAIRNTPAKAEIQHGMSQAGQFPSDAFFEMDKNFPNGVKLADALDNTNSFLVVSERFKDLLQAADALKKNEVYEISIVNHKKRREKAKYFLIHQVNFPLCADPLQTVGEKDPLNPVAYGLLTKLVLDEGKIDPGLSIFRAAEYPERAFFRRDLVAKIKEAGLTGIKFYELDGFRKF